MSKSAFLQYDPSAHAEEYGWLWTEDENDEPCWHLIFTIEDDGDLRVYFVAGDQTEDAEAYAGQPFVGGRRSFEKSNGYAKVRAKKAL